MHVLLLYILFPQRSPMKLLLEEANGTLWHFATLSRYVHLKPQCPRALSGAGDFRPLRILNPAVLLCKQSTPFVGTVTSRALASTPPKQVNAFLKIIIISRK